MHIEIHSIAYTTTSNVNLKCKNFEFFHVLLSLNGNLHQIRIATLSQPNKKIIDLILQGFTSLGEKGYAMTTTNFQSGTCMAMEKKAWMTSFLIPRVFHLQKVYSKWDFIN